MDRIAENNLKSEPHPAVASSLNGITAIVGISVFFFLPGPTSPYNVLVFILATIPLVAGLVWFRSKGLYEIAGTRGDPRPSLAVAFGGSSIALALRALLFQPLSFTPAALCAVVGGIAITFFMSREDQRIQKEPAFVPADQYIDKRQVFFVTVFLFTAAYVFGASSQANALLDTAPPNTYSVTVIRKTIAHHNKGGPTFYLWLAPWGPRQETRAESVAPWLYDSVAPGQNVCVLLHPGALRMPWYDVTSCH